MMFGRGRGRVFAGPGGGACGKGRKSLIPLKVGIECERGLC